MLAPLLSTRPLNSSNLFILEKVIHGLRTCMQEHWKDNDFAVVKVDMCNAFNLVSRQARLSLMNVPFITPNSFRGSLQIGVC